MNPAERVAAIRARLISAFSPVELDIADESRLHAGHPGALEGKGHYRVTIVSSAFVGKRPLERHRMVFEALDDLMRTDIHAMSIDAEPPSKGIESDPQA